MYTLNIMKDFMQQSNHIIDLLSKFLSGTISSKEKSDLYRYMVDDHLKGEIIELLQQQWDNEPQLADEIPSKAMFEKIKKTIEAETSLSGLSIPVNQSSKSDILRWRSFLRYAAVFVVAFGLSWFAKDWVTKDAVTSFITGIVPQYIEVLVPYGSKTKVMLPDSSAVWLNAGARLKYPASFNGVVREVFLQGEGFFDIAEDREHPFIVSSNGLNIKVLGTKFNLMANADDNIIETTLIEGAIEVLGLVDANTQGNISLKPGQKLTMRKENDKYEIQSIQEAGLSIPEEAVAPVKIKSAKLLEKANVEIVTAWTENKLVFDKERFGEVKIKLERWYGVTIDVKDSEILDYRFTGTFEKQTFEQAMNALSRAASCKFKIDKDLVTVSKQ